MAGSLWRVPCRLVGFDEEAVRKALAVLADPASGCQLHGLPSGKCQTRPGNDLDALVEGLRLIDGTGSKNLYYSLNPAPVTQGEQSARNREIICRRWFLIDLDPIKPPEFKDHPATDEEHRLVAEVAQEITDDLLDRGWPLPVLVDSGNGYHLLYRIDLPNNDHARLLCKAALQGLRPFHGEKALVGFECHDARRIAKLPGSTARKGEESEGRPFRPVRLLQVPDPLELVTVEQLEQLGGVGIYAPKGDASPSPASVAGPSGMERWSALRGRAGASSGRSWALSALERERQRILTARPNSEAGRNVCLNRAAYALAGFVAGGHLRAEEVETALKEAARTAGLGDWEIDRTFASGFEAGESAPRNDEALAPYATATVVAPDGTQTREPVTIQASKIKPQKVLWLWPGRIPLGKLTTFAGIGGLGKTFVLLDMAARVTVGGEWPDGGRVEAGEVLFISGEDDPDDTLVPRLIELGADLRRVRFLRTKALDKFSLADLPVLEQAARECQGPLRLVVIDPPTAYLNGVDDHKNAELRALLSPLKEWAKHVLAALVFNTHVNKATQKVEAMARVMGSVAWVNAVRAAHLFARDPDDPDKVLFVPMKNNLGPRRLALTYRIVAAGDLARIEWTGEVDTTADQAINQAKGKSRKVVASEWLIERFREKLEWESADLFKAASAQGVSRNAIFEAKDTLNLPRARKVTSQKGDSTWVWWVPADWPRLSEIGPIGSDGGPVSPNSLSGSDLLTDPASDPPIQGSGQTGQTGQSLDIPW